MSVTGLGWLQLLLLLLVFLSGLLSPWWTALCGKMSVPLAQTTDFRVVPQWAFIAPVALLLADTALAVLQTDPSLAPWVTSVRSAQEIIILTFTQVVFDQELLKPREQVAGVALHEPHEQRPPRYGVSLTRVSVGRVLV